MKTKKLPQNRLVEAIDEIIENVRAAGLDETVSLLKIARLDLVLRANGVSEADLTALLDTVEMNLQSREQPEADLQGSGKNAIRGLAGNC